MQLQPEKVLTMMYLPIIIMLSSFSEQVKKSYLKGQNVLSFLLLFFFVAKVNYNNNRLEGQTQGRMKGTEVLTRSINNFCRQQLHALAFKLMA